MVLKINTAEPPLKSFRGQRGVVEVNPFNYIKSQLEKIRLKVKGRIQETGGGGAI